MVFPDLSAPESGPQNKKSFPVSLAFVADRFLALALDFLIFSPIVSLFVAALVKRTKTYFLLDAQSPEGFALGVLVFVVGTLVVVLSQSLFLYFWQATPGQLFMQMRVVSYPQQRERLSYSQCLIRSLFFCGSFVFMALPFLEVLSHPLRRAIHERASDTLVVTLKKVYDEGPDPLEVRFISSWMRMSFLFFALVGGLSLLKTYRSMHSVAYREKYSDVVMCKELKDDALQGTARLDAALSLFMLNEISDECLNKEAEVALWADPVNSQDLAYLAKVMVTEGEERERYFSRACKDETSTVCVLAKYLKEGAEESVLAEADSKLWVTQVLQMEQKYAARDISGSLEAIEKLQQVPALKSGLEKRYIRSIWALREKSHASSGRVPASVKKQSWIEDFKERYGIE